jgi:hypothetical protein
LPPLLCSSSADLSTTAAFSLDQENGASWARDAHPDTQCVRFSVQRAVNRQAGPWLTFQKGNQTTPGKGCRVCLAEDEASGVDGCTRMPRWHWHCEQLLPEHSLPGASYPCPLLPSLRSIHPVRRLLELADTTGRFLCSTLCFTEVRSPLAHRKCTRKAKCARRFLPKK